MLGHPAIRSRSFPSCTAAAGRPEHSSPTFLQARAYSANASSCIRCENNARVVRLAKAAPAPQDQPPSADAAPTSLPDKAAKADAAPGASGPVAKNDGEAEEAPQASGKKKKQTAAAGGLGKAFGMLRPLPASLSTPPPAADPCVFSCSRAPAAGGSMILGGRAQCRRSKMHKLSWPTHQILTAEVLDDVIADEPRVVGMHALHPSQDPYAVVRSQSQEFCVHNEGCRYYRRRGPIGERHDCYCSSGE